MLRCLSVACLTLSLLPVASAAQDAGAGAGALDHFERKVRPVLAARCYPCHSGNGSAAPQGGLALDSARGIRQGGNSGAKVIAPGDPDASLLIRAIRQTDAKLKMPPGGKALPPEVVVDFEQWVKAGAPLPEDRVVTAPAAGKTLWSLQKPAGPAVPSVRETSRVRTDIDRFIQSRLEAKGLTLSPEADRRTLIRRVSFDLTGLPPTAEEVERFVADRSPKAWETLVDRLLASPHYGERWARHWLDVARYADSVNDSVNTGNRYAWSYTYRDWVIQAFNEDLPWNEFVLYQLAADRLPKDKTNPRHLAALGFLSLGREFPNSYPETVDDRIDAVTRGFMGFTVACARCHDHKYDPIPTKDYYSLYSVLTNIREPQDLPLLAKTGRVWDKQSDYEARLTRIREFGRQYRERRHAEMLAFFRTQTPEYIAAARASEKLGNPEIEELVRERQLNAYVLGRWRKFLATEERWRTAPVADLAKELAARETLEPLQIPLEDFSLICTEGDNNNMYANLVRYKTVLAQSAYDGAPARAMSVEDLPQPKPVPVYIRGNPANPGAMTKPRFLTCLGGADESAFQDGSGRLELARAIVDPANPLTARVAVNRIWMHHFGSGLVRTPSDFGFRGEPPTHPELLDYLAVKFVESGWSVKKLHRMILMSAAYRQSSADVQAARAVDPENQLLWRMNRRRLEIEALRDAALAAAGRLDLTVGGLPESLTSLPSSRRRSVYGFIERGRVPGVLNAFDFASPDQHAPMRFTTTVPQQALFFLNSPFMAEQARQLAARAQTGADEDRIRALYRYVFARSPEASEVEAGLKYLRQESDPAGNPEPPPSPWKYGWGDPAKGTFEEFGYFLGDRWQGGLALPAAKSGRAALRAGAGEPGDTAAQSVIRRWISPVSGKVSIEGTLRHGQPAVPYGDGVRGRILSSRFGELASWNVNGSSAETRLGGIAVEKGDVLDFVVDSRQDPDNDGFGWAPVIRLGSQTWNAADEFVGPSPVPLKKWERYAQVLLETNEFSFVD